MTWIKLTVYTETKYIVIRVILSICIKKPFVINDKRVIFSWFLNLIFLLALFILFFSMKLLFLLSTSFFLFSSSFFLFSSSFFSSSSSSFKFSRIYELLSALSFILFLVSISTKAFFSCSFFSSFFSSSLTSSFSVSFSFSSSFSSSFFFVSSSFLGSSAFSSTIGDLGFNSAVYIEFIKNITIIKNICPTKYSTFG